MSTVRREELLLALYNGMFETPLWSTFLNELKESIGADYVSLIFRRRDAPINQITELKAGKTAPSSLYRRYLEEVHLQDPVPYHELEPGRIYSIAELVDMNEPSQADYVKNFLVASRANYVQIMRAVEPSGYSGWITLCRIDSEFDTESLDLVRSLSPHIAAALRSFASNHRGDLRQAMYSQALNKLNFGCLTLDRNGFVVECDENSSELLRDSGVLKRYPRGRFRLLGEHSDDLFAALNGFADESGATSRAIPLNSDPQLEVLLVPVRDPLCIGDHTPVAIGYVHGDNCSNADRHDQLVELFGLSRTEARLALALSRGRTIAEAAEALGITLETARNYSKRIYSKTGVRRQAELVRLVLSSVVALA